MKRLFLLAFICMVPMLIKAQVQEFKTIIYTDDNLAAEIQQVRSGSNLLGVTLDAAKGIGGGYVTSFVDLGVNAVASLFTKSSRQKQEWEEAVKEENSWSMHITSIQDVKDFYKETSLDGAMDPKGMTFDGIGCLRMEGPDTVFFISCHIDRTKLDRITKHSKFELVLDTLILSPYHSNLPNSQLPLTYSFEERKNFNLGVDIKITSSWMTQLIELHNNESLGEFTLTIPVDAKKLDDKGFLRYVREENSPSEYEVLGECFIVPRSYMAIRDSEGEYENSWGTGQYQLDITLSETCDITDAYRENWKADWKKRSSMKPKSGFFATAWQTVSKQNWDELSQQWVITTLSAPAGVISNDLIEAMGLNTTSTSTTATQQAAASLGQMPMR